MSLPVAIQVYSVRDDAKKDLKGTLQKIKQLGYDGVEFAGLYDHSPAEVKAMCEEIGLTPISAHISLADIRKDLKGLVATYAEIGVKYMALAWLGEENRPGAEGWDATRADMIEMAKECKKNGITFLYHNHDFEFEKLDGKYKLEVIYDTIPADLLQSELDTCWVNVGGENPADYVRKFTGRAPLVHLKDFVGKKSANMYELIGTDSAKADTNQEFGLRYVGEGVQDFPAIIKASEDAGCEWLIVEQDSPSPDRTPLECAELSRKYLKSIGC